MWCLGRSDAVTEEEWLASTDLRAMLALARRCSRENDRTLRLFTVACCRRLWHLFDDERAREAVEVAERFADGLAGAEELADASRRAGTASDQLFTAGQISTALALVAHLASHRYAGSGPASAIKFLPRVAVGRNDPTLPDFIAEQKGQAGLLRGIFGPWPFRPPAPLAPALFAWRDGLVQALAESAYDDRDLPSGHLDSCCLAVLADALEEAGADAELLSHLRGPGPHVRGDWAVDLVLGLS
jgi:hypothetical protein